MFDWLGPLQAFACVMQILMLGALHSVQPRAANLLEQLSLALALPMLAVKWLVSCFYAAHSVCNPSDSVAAVFNHTISSCDSILRSHLTCC